ncbi:aquaporin-like protein [Xylogone sp. PMI_703]|nr:aquaporin-like protein [Xylogone sp. PMI_703]
MANKVDSADTAPLANGNHNGNHNGSAPLPTLRSVQTVRQEVGSGQHYIVTMLGEFFGTVLFLFFAYAGVQVGKTALGGNPSTTGEYLVFLLFGAISFGASLAINVWIFYRVSGGLFNPAVTFAFVITGLMHPIKGVMIFITQLIAGIVAAALISALTPGPLSVANSLGPHVNIAQGLFMEMFLTAELILAIFMLAVEKHRGTYLAPIGIGIALFMGHIVGIYFTGAGLNPARSLGPAVVQRTFPGYFWIYWVGPGLGALLASAVYKLLLFLQYETANPDQDRDSPTLTPLRSGSNDIV